ncbi:hypothetical protein SG34_033495 [Thalassomonas viridans]|uniref:Uncharacterized protein n=1 Tax=Thalassomonas viridans TaxID=137584 RepID=A0AAE9ZA93_9GAMM|nr:hypothetical protein [Thalassomonas viridans]WDE08810.1 hypothetical protein SG34_033495 [Thalassomonas viridans]
MVYQSGNGEPSSCSGFGIDAVNGYDLLMLDFNYVATDMATYTVGTSYRTGIFYGIEYFYGLGDAPDISGMTYTDLKNNFNHGRYNFTADNPIIYAYAHVQSDYEWMAFMPAQRGNFMLGTASHEVNNINPVPISSSICLFLFGIIFLILHKFKLTSDITQKN